MTIKSQCLLFAVSMIASAAPSVTAIVWQLMFCAWAVVLSSPRIRAASCSAAFWYSMKAAAVSLLAIDSHGSIAVTAVTCGDGLAGELGAIGCDQDVLVH